jgi:alpha-mannosidase
LPTSKRIGHYVPSTHWDREWYETFQDYRFRLVNLLDEALAMMASRPAFKYFQMDGQVITIEDYLEIRPERESEIRELAKSGRLKLGPWYVLPDEFLVSGESLIRNLQMGMEVSRRFAEPSKAGFMCDMFGHISQMPQILRGFGIDNALLWRGVNEVTHGAMFRWQSPDGSEVMVYRFSPRSGYCSYAFKVRKCHQPDATFDFETAVKDFREYLDFETGRCPTNAFLVFDGGDHMEIEPRTVELLAEANKRFGDVEIVSSNLDAFFDEVRGQRNRITRTFVGELRDSGMQGDEQWLIPGVLSSRIHLKQANARCENELCLWAEPFSVFATRSGRPYPAGFLRTAWRHLLANHPHDSMCACSIDQVHKDMVYRFDQAELIASHVTRDALSHFAQRVRLPEMGEKDMAVVVFNPGSEPIDGPADLTLRFPQDIDTVYEEWFGFEKKIGFRLFDPEGRELPYQYVNQRRERCQIRRPMRKFPTSDLRHEVDVTVPLRVPAYGYTTVICRPVKEPTRYLGTTAVDDHTIENEHLKVSVNCNGTLSLTDKRSGQVYDRLLTMEDCADIGDGWYHGTAVNEKVYTSAASSADVALTADGLHKATLTIRVVMNLPERFEFGSKMLRSESLKPLIVTHHVTLRKGGEAVEVRTEVDNVVRDHRLRVLFPTGAKAAKFMADQAFDVVERPIALRPDNAGMKEMEVETKPQQTWTAVHDDQRGLAVVSTGLPEATVRDQPERPIALTLLRSFIRAVLTSGNEGGEIQGRHEFHYRIVPLSGKPAVARLCRLGQQLAGGIRAVQQENRDIVGRPDAAPPERTLPAAQSFMTVDRPDVVVTAVHKRTGDEAVAVRMFNPTDRSIESTLTTAAIRGEATIADLSGAALAPAAREGDKVRVSLKPRQIVTIQWAG